MRNHLIGELSKIADEDPRVVVLTADLGYSVLDEFSRLHPGRCVNMGICEQNMAAVAAGLAIEGHVVYAYSIGNFPTLRCLEQIRNCICYHEANVKIVAVGGGFVYGQLGMSHHATEDLAVMRALPGMRVFCPADSDDAVEILRHVHATPGPCYIRLARGGEKLLHPECAECDATRLLELRRGDRVAVVATGTILSEALMAADALFAKGDRVGVYDCMCLKPFDEAGALEIARSYDSVITVEEHNVVGGLGSAFADFLAGQRTVRTAQLLKLGLRDTYTSVVGSQDYLRRHYHLSAADIVECVEKLQ